jgi:protein-S-isoprenylcysteine O-methyltransferase Ste14
MIWWVAYLALVLVLLVRLVPPGTTARPPVRPGPDEPLRLVRTHHALFYAILLGAPLEALVLGGTPARRGLGVVLFAAGVAMYRIAGRALGEALSPLVSPRPGAALVTSGPYRYLRHPMYVGQALIAVGAPLTLGCRWVVWLALPALVVLGLRMASEEAALARTFPGYGGWAARAKRLIPFVF